MALSSEDIVANKLNTFLEKNPNATAEQLRQEQIKAEQGEIAINANALTGAGNLSTDSSITNTNPLGDGAPKKLMVPLEIEGDERVELIALKSKINAHGKPKQEEPIFSIFLPMPTNLSIPEQHSYGSQELGSGAAGLGEILKAVNSVQKVSDIKKAAGDVVSGVGKSLGPKLIKDLRGGIGTLTNAALDVNLEAGLQLANRTKLNPHMEVLYDNTGFRSLSLAWPVAPKNADESKNLKELITVLKYYSAPEFPTSTNQQWMNFPNNWRIKFKTKGGENKNLPKFGVMVMTGVQVDYNNAAGGWASFIDSNGAPLDAQITLSMQEVIINSKARIKAGG